MRNSGLGSMLKACFVVVSIIVILSSVASAQSGDELMKSGKPKAAVKAYEDALENNPDDIALMKKIAEAGDAAGWYGKSVQYWEKIIQQDQNGKYSDEARKKAAFAHRWIAIRYYDTGMALNWVMEHLDEAIKLDPVLFEAYYWKARILYEKGELKETEKILKEALKNNPGEKKGEWLLEVVQGSLANGEEAYLAYAEAYNYYEKGNLDKALEIYRAAVESNPNYAAAYSWIARINMERQNYTEAIAAYEKVLELEPDNARAAWFLKVCRKEQTTKPEATVPVE